MLCYGGYVDADRWGRKGRKVPTFRDAMKRYTGKVFVELWDSGVGGDVAEVLEGREACVGNRFNGGVAAGAAEAGGQRRWGDAREMAAIYVLYYTGALPFVRVRFDVFWVCVVNRRR